MTLLYEHLQFEFGTIVFFFRRWTLTKFPGIQVKPCIYFEIATARDKLLFSFPAQTASVKDANQAHGNCKPPNPYDRLEAYSDF